MRSFTTRGTIDKVYFDAQAAMKWSCGFSIHEMILTGPAQCSHFSMSIDIRVRI